MSIRFADLDGAHHPPDRGRGRAHTPDIEGGSQPPGLRNESEIRFTRSREMQENAKMQLFENAFNFISKDNCAKMSDGVNKDAFVVFA